MVEYFITMGISTILMALKDPILKRKFENAFLKIHRAIGAAFPDKVNNEQRKN